MTATLSIHIDATVTVVFDALRDPARWQDVADNLEYTDVVITPEGVGTRYTWCARVAGIPIRGSGVFTEFVPNQRITDASSLALEGTWTYLFEPEGSGTRLTLKNSQRGLWRLPVLHALVDRLAVKSHRQVLLRLKERLEADTAAP